MLPSSTLFAVYTTGSALCGVPLYTIAMDRIRHSTCCHLPRRNFGIIYDVSHFPKTHGPSAMLAQRAQACCIDTANTMRPAQLAFQARCLDLSLRTISYSWIRCHAILVRCSYDIPKACAPIPGSTGT